SIKGETGNQIMKPGGRYVALNDLPELDLRQKKEGFYESLVPRKEYLDAEAFAGIIKAYQKGAFHAFISMKLSASLKHVIQA
ncbi:NADP-dependent oxidoreductase, partial [Enterococcus faecium]